jgi:hypothetical protein
MSRHTFLQLFKIVDPNTLRVLRKVKVGGFEIDKGAEINRGVTFAGIDFFNYISADYEGQDKDGTFVIEKIYPHG